jgi:hypothetical protein
MQRPIINPGSFPTAACDRARFNVHIKKLVQVICQGMCSTPKRAHDADSVPAGLVTWQSGHWCMLRVAKQDVDMSCIVRHWRKKNYKPNTFGGDQVFSEEETYCSQKGAHLSINAMN